MDGPRKAADGAGSDVFRWPFLVSLVTAVIGLALLWASGGHHAPVVQDLGLILMLAGMAVMAVIVIRAGIRALGRRTPGGER